MFHLIVSKRILGCNNVWNIGRIRSQIPSWQPTSIHSFFQSLILCNNCVFITASFPERNYRYIHVHYDVFFDCLQYAEKSEYVAEEIQSEGYTSIGVLYSNGTTSISVSFADSTMGMHIVRE